jgi:hypothetical protein
LAKNRHVLVLERISEREWKAVDGEVGGDRIKVFGAEVLKSDSGTPDFARLANSADIILVSNSARAVCRFLDLASAPSDQTERMVALRLETELPYPVAESTWVWERQGAGNVTAGSVLVIATGTAEITQAEEELRANGKRCTGVEFDGTGLAELAVACGPPVDTVALVSLGGLRATLAITHAGRLRYVRRISLGAVTSEEESTKDDAVSRLANELDQSVYDYLLRTGGARPERVLVAGEGMDGQNTIEAVGARLRLPVESARLPEVVDIPEQAAARGELLARFPECVGALIAVHRRFRGEKTAAPALRRQQGWRFGQIDLRDKRVALIFANAVLFVALIAALFGVRASQLRAANRIIEESRPLLPDLERLEDEVDILEYESRRQRAILDVLVPIAEALPGQIKVETLKIDGKGKVTITGKSKSAEDVSDKAISAMQTSRMLANPKFLGATKEKDGFAFQITCELRAGSGGAGK